MTKDDIANYVIKTALACAREDQKKQILNVLSNNRIELVCIMVFFCLVELRICTSESHLGFSSFTLQSKYRQASYIFTNESPSVVSS